MTVSGPGGATVSADYAGGFVGAAVTRCHLDQWLLESATRAGADFEAGVTVNAPVLSEDRVVAVRASHRSTQYEVRARVVIAADGRASRIATAMQLSKFARSPQRWAHGAYFTDVDGLSGHGEMHLRQDGYVGVAPLPGGLANVCVVRARPHLTHGEPGESVIVRALATDSALAARFTRARRVSEVSVLGPLAIDSEGAGCPGLLLAGDAAGFVDPMTGDGLRFAIRGGELAAEAAINELNSGRSAYRALHARRMGEFAGKWRFNRVLRALVDSPRALTLAARAAHAWPAPVTRLVGVAGDLALARRTAFAPSGVEG
jgi:flavin-dependent dehydrogenase